MEESKTIVADPTCGMGNLLHESSGDNVLASASWGHTEGLATSQATTSRNLCSAVTPAARMWFKRKLGVPSSFRRSEGSTCEQVRTCALAMAPWRMGGSMAGRRKTDTQSGESPCSVRADSGMPLCQRCLLERGKAHEVVVPVTTVITSRTRKGPLGVRGDCRRGDLGYCPIIQSSGDTVKLSWATQPQNKVEPRRLSEAWSKLVVRKALSNGYARHLKLDWGNLTVQDFRGDGGNLALEGTFPRAKASPFYSTLKNPRALFVRTAVKLAIIRSYLTGQ